MCQLRYNKRMTKRLAVIDGKSIFYRGYFAMPNLSMADGTPTGGVFGFASLAIELIKKLEPDYVAVAWDKKGTNIRKRKEIFADYKAGRKPAPDDFYAQMPILFELLEAFGWPLYEMDDYEADDIMGAFAHEATEKGIETCLLTSDLDALQLVGPLVKVYALKNGLSNIEEFDVEYFEKKYGIRVDQFLDLKSLKGDSSDNLPGVPGIGEKTATQLLQQFGTLDDIYENLDQIKPAVASKLVAGKASAYMSKEVGRIWWEAPIKLDWDIADINDINLQKIADILQRLEFTSLVRRLPKHMQATESEQIIKSPVLVESLTETEWPKILSIDGPVAIYADDDFVWISTDKKTVSRNKISDVNKSVWRALELAQIVTFDGKTLYHQLASFGVDVRFSELHDIHQAGFLINPLRRDQTLAGLAGGEISDEKTEILATIWRLYEDQLAIFETEPKLSDIAHRFDFPLVYILFKMEQRGIKIDFDLLARMSIELGDKFSVLEKEIFDLVGHEFNIGSPLQLSDVLFKELKLPTSGIKKGKSGFSTGQKELDKLRGQHKIIELIEQTRELAKLKNTYIDALPLLVDADNRIHTTFNQDTVSTGRLSSTNPNLQNIPVRSEIGRQIREAFIPGKGNVFVSADYSQFELRLAAVMAGDQQMIADFNNDIDIHTKTASEIYKVPIDEVTKSQRRNAKTINFGVLYGMSPHGLGAATGMSFVEAKKFIDDYFDLREPIRHFISQTIDQAKNKGYVETYFGRRRPTPDVMSSNFMVRMSAERAAANMPIQGTEADLMKLAMIEVDKKLVDLGTQLLQVHDSILIECPVVNSDKVSQILQETMENIAPDLKVKLKVDIGISNNWS